MPEKIKAACRPSFRPAETDGDTLTLRFGQKEPERTDSQKLYDLVTGGVQSEPADDLARLAEIDPGRLQGPEEQAMYLLTKYDYEAFAHMIATRRQPNGVAGKHLYEGILKWHGINIDADRLKELLQADIQRMDRKLAALAREIDPDAMDWRAVLKTLRKNHPAEEELQNAYRQRILEVQRFFRERDLVTLPESELPVEETPEEIRHWIRSAGYDPQSPRMLVTPFVSANPAGRKKEMAIAHNDGARHVNVIHEVFGHYVQDAAHVKTSAAMPDSPLLPHLMMYDDPFFKEGWATYVEKLMLEEGYYRLPQGRFMALAHLHAVATMAWLNAKVHTGEVSLLEVFRFLLKNRMLTQKQASIEARLLFNRKGMLPLTAYSAGYYLGMLQILQLRDYLQKSQPDFSLKTFHDRLIHGLPLPVPVLAKMNFGIDLPPLETYLESRTASPAALKFGRIVPLVFRQAGNPFIQGKRV